MKHQRINILVPLFFIITAGFIVYFYLNQRYVSNDNPQIRQARVITPQTNSAVTDNATETAAERLAYEDLNLSKIALADDETALSVLTQNLDSDPQDEQIIVYWKNTDANSTILVAYIDFDEILGLYKKVWESAVLATKPRTVRLLVKDLLGDRSNCIILEGLNDSGEQTLTAFLIPQVGYEIRKITELKIDGTIVITEIDRTQAYELGIASGIPFTISTFGRDYESSNLLDQIEVKYAYNNDSGMYERIGTARIPGSQIEQRQIRELLDGTAGKFEQFLNGLWYYTNSAQNSKQYIYFDTIKREIVFYEDKTQEVYRWQNSSPTRYGIYVNSQNLSVTTLKRLIDISLESKDSVAVRIFEDVQLKIGITGHWDGVYQKMSTTFNNTDTKNDMVEAWVNARYESNTDSIIFTSDGSFEKVSQGKSQRGNYSFFVQDGVEILELRFNGPNTTTREIYKVEREEVNTNSIPQHIMKLTKIRLGIYGIENMNEGTLQYTLIR